MWRRKVTYPSHQVFARWRIEVRLAQRDDFAHHDARDVTDDNSALRHLVVDDDGSQFLPPRPLDPGHLAIRQHAQRRLVTAEPNLRAPVRITSPRSQKPHHL